MFKLNKKIGYKAAGFVAIFAAGAVVVQAPYAAAAPGAYNASGNCVKVDKDGGYVWTCRYHDTSMTTRSFSAGSVSVHNHTKVFVGISVTNPPLPPQPPQPPVTGEVTYTITIREHGVTRKTMQFQAEPGLSAPTAFVRSPWGSPAGALKAAGLEGYNLVSAGGSGTDLYINVEKQVFVTDVTPNMTDVEKTLVAQSARIISAEFTGGVVGNGGTNHASLKIEVTFDDGSTKVYPFEHDVLWNNTGFAPLIGDNVRVYITYTWSGGRLIGATIGGTHPSYPAPYVYGTRTVTVLEPDGTVTVTFSDNTTEIVDAPGPEIGSPRA